MSVYGLIAMLIGAVGIYGVIAAVVVQQTREIGLRVALGATPVLIHRRVLALAATHVLIGADDWLAARLVDLARFRGVPV